MRGSLPVAVERVRLENYRSIASCDVTLNAVTYLVGPNGAGKSNFLDALRLVAESLSTSLEQAVRDRGGLDAIKHRGADATAPVSVHCEVRLPAGLTATYGVELELLPRSGFGVRREVCEVSQAGRGIVASFDRLGDAIRSTDPILPAPPPSRLYLTTAASLASFRMVFNVLTRMGFYNISPSELREIQPPDVDDVLDRGARNAAGVLARLEQESPSVVRRIEEYLAAVVPGVIGVDTDPVGARQALYFLEARSEDEATERFLAQSMSDGTLRAFGVLLALFQRADVDRDLVLVGVEEPEAAVHPAAAAVLRDAVAEAGAVRQLLITTHSPELLDDPDLDAGSLLAVESVNGRTVISAPEPAALSAVRERLYTAGELLRIGQLQPADAPEAAST